ncbi:MAG TPA: restriction endonuclease subunit S, partial [Blastocatellia bacterium]|nr:restriction endonuclease subunit S [Blastocatellia bacterium]
PAYCVYRFKSNALAWYYHQLLRLPLYKGRIKAASTGVVESRLRLYSDDLGRIEALVPPLDEQAAIVRFLDHANRKFDGFIRAKRKLIALLNEQKQAIIDRAVTRGLNPDVKLKPSGIPWLGDIPAHWEVRKIKSLVKTIGGMTPDKSNAAYWGGRIPWVSPKDMKLREIWDSQDHITEAALRQTSISIIQPPAVLIVVRGMILARTFPTATTKVPVTVNQDMKALLPKSNLRPDYFVFLLTGIQRDLLQLVEIAGHGTCCLRTDSWGNFSLAIPPLAEQEAISKFLSSELDMLNVAIARTEREIALMQEYRTRLTADIVTGKLDVRAAAAQLPQVEDEPLRAEVDDELLEEADAAETTED